MNPIEGLSQEQKDISPEEMRQELLLLRQEIEALKLENIKLKENLISDELTGLRTRNYLKAEVENDLAAVRGHQEEEKRRNPFESLSIIFCDIDNFKRLNDDYSHHFGDQVLKAVAKTLLDNVRDTDIVSRWGGEEMVICLRGADVSAALAKAEVLRQKVSELEFDDHPDLQVTLSLGVASTSDGPEERVDDLVKRADGAMYKAKTSGKNRVETLSAGST